MFVKVAARESRAAFEAEAAGLAALERARALRVPRVLAVGESAGSAFLALEWLESRAGGCQRRAAPRRRARRAARADRAAFRLAARQHHRPHPAAQ